LSLIAKNSPAELNGPSAYFVNHALRFYQTYKACRDLVTTDASILSVGAGPAFVEFVLSRELALNVTVFDFEEAIVRNSHQYATHGFQAISGNFVQDLARLGNKRFDLIIFGEIVEHIPMPPDKQFEILRRHLNPGGHLVVTTPNIANLYNIRKLVRGKNIIARADRLFSPVCADFESVHRREYVLDEICTAMRSTGLSVTKRKYILLRYPRRAFKALLAFIVFVSLRRWRPMMLVVGQNGN